MIDKIKNIMATKKNAKASDNVVELAGAQMVDAIQPQSVDELKRKYMQDRNTLAQRIEQEKVQLNALDGAIAACEQLITSHTRTDKVELNG